MHVWSVISAKKGAKGKAPFVITQRAQRGRFEGDMGRAVCRRTVLERTVCIHRAVCHRTVLEKAI